MTVVWKDRVPAPECRSLCQRGRAPWSTGAAVSMTAPGSTSWVRANDSSREFPAVLNRQGAGAGPKRAAPGLPCTQSLVGRDVVHRGQDGGGIVVIACVRGGDFNRGDLDPGPTSGRGPKPPRCARRIVGVRQLRALHGRAAGGQRGAPRELSVARRCQRARRRTR